MGRGRWRSVPAPARTIFEVLNREFEELEKTQKDSLPNLHKAQTLLVGSDYSGESSGSPYCVYSFLLTSAEAWLTWETKRLEVRKRCFSDSRRMSFKRLGDKQRKRALGPLLEAADCLEGLSFSAAINKNTSLFAGMPPLDLSNPQFEAFRKWKKAPLEKAFVIVNFISFLLAGLSRELQDVLWFTDEDMIAANDKRVCELSQLFMWISSLYLTFSLGHGRCGTSRCDNGSRQIEDLLAIPDLIAGAIAEQLSLKEHDDMPELKDVFWVHRPEYSDKTKKITWWLSNSQKPLKRLLCIIDPSKDGKKDVVSWYHFDDRIE